MNNVQQYRAVLELTRVAGMLHEVANSLTIDNRHEESIVRQIVDLELKTRAVREVLGSAISTSTGVKS